MIDGKGKEVVTEPVEVVGGRASPVSRTPSPQSVRPSPRGGPVAGRYTPRMMNRDSSTSGGATTGGGHQARPPSDGQVASKLIAMESRMDSKMSQLDHQIKGIKKDMTSLMQLFTGTGGGAGSPALRMAAAKRVASGRIATGGALGGGGGARASPPPLPKRSTPPPLPNSSNTRPPPDGQGGVAARDEDYAQDARAQQPTKEGPARTGGGGSVTRSATFASSSTLDTASEGSPTGSSLSTALDA